MALSLYDIPFILISFLFLAFALFLFLNRRGRPLSNYLLGGFFAAVGLNVLDGYLLYRGVYNYIPHFAFWLNAIPALYGPLLFFYTKSVLYRDFRLSWNQFWHGGLFLITMMIFVWTYHLRPVEYKLFFLDNAKSYNGFEIVLGNIILITQIGLYLFFSFRIIRQYKQALERRFSDLQQTQLSWLQFNLMSYTVVFFLTLIYSATRFVIWEGQLNLTAAMVITLLFLVFLLAVIYRALTQSSVFNEIKESDLQAKKYAYSSLSDTEIQQHFQSLLQLMESQKPWLDPKLSIANLARQMDLPAKTLSQVINATTGQNFFDFINRRRIAAAQHLLLHPNDQKMTVSEIMYRVGFNSKSSFNTAFKKYTGLTPSEFKRKN